jgi:ribosome biogenesis protein NSA2
MYTQLGVMTKGTVIEVNVSELGMVTTAGKVVFGKYAQITNNPENDGCINAVLRAFLPLLICLFCIIDSDLVSYLSPVIQFTPTSDPGIAW